MCPQNSEFAYLAGGCFWCLEALFVRIPGVLKVVSGYMGGRTVNPSYEEVCQGLTGHAETVAITFDINEIDYSHLLDIFFYLHDPTTLNRQGNDAGTQYRSEIFYVNEYQKIKAHEKIQELEKSQVFSNKIVTAVSVADKFYKAEDYHQAYFANNSSASYCNYVIRPKIKFLESKLNQ